MSVIEDVKQAVKYTSEGKYKEAEKLYKAILIEEPNNSVVLSCLGLLYLNLALFDKAKKYLLKSYSISPHSTTIEGLGLLYYYRKDNNKAIEYFDKIINKTKNFEVFEKYIDIMLEDKKHSKAFSIAEKYKERYPLKKEADAKLGLCLMHIGKFPKAFNIFTRLVKQYPKYAEAWQKLGLIYEMYYHDEEMAKHCYENVVNCGDEFCGYANLLINASKRFDFDDAFEYIKKIDRIIKKTNPDKTSSDFYMDINFTKAVVYFKHREFLKAYKYYIKRPYDFMKLKPLDKLKNFWDGKTYKNETLLVYFDQGVGDGIMFSRYLPFITDKFKQIKVIDKTFIFSGLLKRSFKEYKNIKVYNYNNHMPKYDKSTLVSSLPHLLKMDIDNIPSAKGYFIPNNDNIEKYKKYFQNDKYNVGICWEAGGAGWRELLNRTLNVSLYEPFFNVENTQFYSLQVNPTMDNYKNYKNIIDLGSTFKDFDDTAGVLKNLDLLITVDTSVAHLAGALGVKTFMLLPYCPDWRWFDNDKTTEWYDSITIFKQKNTKSWDDVIDNIKIELENLSKNI